LERSLDNLDYPSVEVDSFSGFQTMIKHLVENGFRRIAYIGASSDLKIQSDRFGGYQAGLTAAGISFDPTLVGEGQLTRQGGYLAAKKLLALIKPPNAIVCINDLTAIGAMEAAKELDLVVGKDLAVVGFDGIEEAAHTQPPLTTINQPLYEIARQLIKMLIDLIADERITNQQIRYQPVQIIRGSTGGTIDFSIS
jgi:LacI family transcriptional regulator